MAWAFVTYLVLKGLKQVWPQFLTLLNDWLFFSFEITQKPTFLNAALFGLVVAVAVFFLLKRSLKKRRATLKNDRASVNILFTVPLIFAAALLSFAHGANDVANAIGPLAAIHDAVMTGGINAKAGIPFWVMAVGAFGIALGLALYGPRLIRTVGGEITELDQMRAFSIAIAAAITVIIASQLGLPVSSTHIAIGGVFGVGFLREWLDQSSHLQDEIAQEKQEIQDEKRLLSALRSELNSLMDKKQKSVADYQRITDLYRTIDEEKGTLKKAKKTLKKEKKSLYVKRDVVKKIITAWLITVPAAAVISACLFYMIKGIME